MNASIYGKRGVSIITVTSLVVVLLSSCGSGDEKTVNGNNNPPKPLVDVEVAFPALTFELPVDLQHTPDTTNRLFVVEQAGKIRVFANDSLTDTASLFLDITDRVKKIGWEEGLLGLAFDPDFQTNGYFYVNYTAANPDRTVISRFLVSPSQSNQANNGTETIILTFEQPFENHNGGGLAFGPDGFLYIGTGDGGSKGDPNNNGQNRKALLGKFLRINVNATSPGKNYSIPVDNPFVGNDSGWREEIFAYGMRNPWRFSFDSSGNLWAGDVGQGKYEEIDIIKNGGNYGWRIMEGMHCYNPSSGCNQSGLMLPVIEYPQPIGASVTGGYVYGGARVPGLQGKYIYADFMTGRIWSADTDGTTASNIRELIKTDLGISSFGTDINNELYMTAFDGKIHRFKQIGVVE
ncbi:MAG: PQQ-dependent sugar dehydrogenase [candidate division Zixibacteria bacterium]|nr:PQQ-dependent sugar dehydrogenase [candidate division Zixibacteria bacterium]